MLQRFWALYKQEAVEFYQKYRGLIWLSILFLLLKIPSLFEPYWYGDEGVTLTIGMAISKGVLLYRDIYDNKPPLLYLIAMISNGNLFLLKLSALLLGLGGVWFFYQLSRFLFSSKRPWVIGFSCILFVFLTTTPIFEGNIVNGEIVFIVFSLAGWYFSLVRKQYLVSGLAFALALLTKVPAVFDMIPLAVLLLAQYQQKPTSAKRLGLIRLSLALFLPIFASFLFFAVRGGLNDYVQSVYLQMFGYVSSWGSTGSQNLTILTLIRSELVVKGVLLLLVGTVFWLTWRGKKTNAVWQLFVFWLLSAIFGATMSGRPYPHYLLQVVSPLCLCIGYFLIEKPLAKILIIVSFGVFVFSYRHYNYWRYPNWAYQMNFLSLLLNRGTNMTRYFQFFDQTLPETYQVAEIIRAYTHEDDLIYAWSNYAQLYSMAHRLPATRYVAAYHQAGNTANYYYLAKSLSRSKLIVVDKRIEPNTNLLIYLDKEYHLVENLPNHHIYVRL